MFCHRGHPHQVAGPTPTIRRYWRRPSGAFSCEPSAPRRPRRRLDSSARPSHRTAPSERLAAALRVAVGSHVEALEEIRQAVAVYVCGLKARGEPPQAVLVSVKDLVRRAPDSVAGPFEPADDGHAVARRERAALSAVVVQWAIEAYYGGGAE